MIGSLALFGVLASQWPGFGHAYLLDPPVWSSSSQGGDPVFSTYVGGDAGLMPGALSPKHMRAAQSIRPFAHWQDHYELLYSRRTVIAGKEHIPKKSSPKVELRPNYLSHLKRVDADGNTILNRLLMSHIVVEEEPLHRAVLYLMKHERISMRSNRLGQTPLMFAVESGYPSLVDEVLKFNPIISQRDSKGNDIFEYLFSSVDRPDNRFSGSRVIYTSESICDALLSHASPSEKESLMVRARFAMNYIRQRTDGITIIP
jgi:hypothetical protein